MKTAILQPPTESFHAHLITDYSPTGSAAILYNTNDFTTPPIHCFSQAAKSTTPPASSTTDGETTTALTYAIKIRQIYHPTDLTIYTDSNNTIHWLSDHSFPSKLPITIQRKLATLLQYGPFTAKYIPTENNPADILTYKTNKPTPKTTVPNPIIPTNIITTPTPNFDPNDIESDLMSIPNERTGM
eukprot:GHVP01024745.1.p1 GENE.GHVP01024745.1~~GHVP01024745.1.p1  ORF type:complete len:197 (+),score=16.17 GHVP01024745.1:36-593(+)